MCHGAHLFIQVGKEVEEEVAGASVVVSVMVSCSYNVMLTGRHGVNLAQLCRKLVALGNGELYSLGYIQYIFDHS